MYLSKSGYCIRKNSLTQEQIQKLRTDLSVSPLVDTKYVSHSESYSIYNESNNIISIPKMYGLRAFGSCIQLKSYLGKDFDSNIEFNGTLLPTQETPVNLLVDACMKKGGGILSLQTGQGKTVCALNVLSKLGGKALVIVNKASLMSQWKTEIQTFLPTARIGQIQGDNVKVNDCDVVIVMLQSLSRRNYPLEVFQDFKVLVVDEIQNIASKVFSKVLFKLCCKYTIGLSATPKRSDGCERVFEWHIGNIIYKSEAIQSGLPLVILRKVLFTENYKERVTDGKIQFTSMITDLVCNKERNSYIVNLVKDFLRDEHRKILILSERRSHLENLYKLLAECDSGLFLGGMKEKDLQETRKKRVILATFAAFSEGVSEKDLNTLILVTPKKYIGHLKNSSKNEKGSMTQICGRILRKSHTHANPVIVDLQDNFSVFKSQNFGRNVFYKTYPTAIHNYENVDLHAEYIRMSNVNERNQECIIEDD